MTNSQLDSRPAPIRTDGSNDWAYHTMKDRLPKIIHDIQTAHPDYAISIQKALDALRESLMTNAPIPMLDLPAPDYDEWTAAYAAHKGHTWWNTDWWFGEIFCYRYIIQAVRWWETGHDPYTPKKVAELESDRLGQLLSRALNVTGGKEERLAKHINHDLWGNRIDLSMMNVVQQGGESDRPEDLLVDDRIPVIEHLLATTGTVHIVADNAGSELAMDLVLIDTLLRDAETTVILHLKMHPTFVSDATIPDVLDFLNRLEANQYGEDANQLGRRLRTAVHMGRLRFAPDLYWNSSRFLWDLPSRLNQTFTQARLVILKGDANYRRMAGDAIWPPETPITQVADYFPAPLLTLRTMKSDVIVGLPAGMATQLDTVDHDWRVNGRRGIIQSTLAK